SLADAHITKALGATHQLRSGIAVLRILEGHACLEIDPRERAAVAGFKTTHLGTSHVVGRKHAAGTGRADDQILITRAEGGDAQDAQRAGGLYASLNGTGALSTHIRIAEARIEQFVEGRRTERIAGIRDQLEVIVDRIAIATEI